MSPKMPKAKKVPEAPAFDPGKPRISYEALAWLAARVFEGNPKNHDLDFLEQAFTANGFVEPIVFDEGIEKIVAGHGRVEELVALKASGAPPPERIEVRKGEWYVPVIRGMRLRDPGKHVVASNRGVELGGWDNKALAGLLSGYAGDLAGTGFSAEDLASFMTLAAGPQSPEQFPTVGEDLQTEHQCPSCHYRWSGSTAPTPQEPDAPAKGRKVAGA